MSQTLTLARPYARAAYQAARDTGSTGDWSQALAFAARVAAGLSQAQAAELMGYPLQTGSRGGVQSRTWQALESTTDERNMQGPVFAMFLLLTGQHPEYTLTPRSGQTL